MTTRRQEIIALLHENAISAQDLANFYKVELWEIIEDLEHIKLTIKHKLKIIPAKCNHCGFVFKERSKIKKPSKCPKCKYEDIKPALFKIKE